MKEKYRIERVDSDSWTVFGEDGWSTYYFGESYRDCFDWVSDHDGEIIEEQ